MNSQKIVNRQRTRRRNRVRRVVRGSAERPRMTVFRSHKNIYVQVIDDLSGKTLAAASSSDKGLRGQIKYGGNVEAAKAVGTAIAERLTKAGIQAVAFDRGSYKYHGRVAALAQAAREAGLKF